MAGCFRRLYALPNSDMRLPHSVSGHSGGHERNEERIAVRTASGKVSKAAEIMKIHGRAAQPSTIEDCGTLRSFARRVAPALVAVAVLAGCADDKDDDAASDAANVETSTDAADVESTDAATPADDESATVDTPQATAPNADASNSTNAPAADSQTATATTAPAANAETEPVVEVSTDELIEILDLGPVVTTELSEPADFGTGVVASILDVEPVDVEGRIPGERSGPGLLVSVEVDNQSDDAISLDYVTVDLIGSDGSSAIPVLLAEPQDFSGELAPGATAVAKYQYYIPADRRQPATITVSYASGVPTALFSGALPDA